MEERLGRQEEALLALTQAVGRWTELFGFTLEDLAREVAPAYLAQHFGIRVEALDRRFFRLDGQEIEVDLYGEGRRDGEAIAVVGEVRSRIYGRDVEAAFKQAERLAPQLPGAPCSGPLWVRDSPLRGKRPRGWGRSSSPLQGDRSPAAVDRLDAKSRRDGEAPGCLKAYRPPVASWKIGRYSEMTIAPTTTPMKMISIGSSIEVRLATVVSTSTS